MDAGRATFVAHRYLDEHADPRGDPDVGPFVSALVDNSAHRLWPVSRRCSTAAIHGSLGRRAGSRERIAAVLGSSRLARPGV
jgi:hypothetical protein